jgi:OmpA-OmpF porin, OOP family
MLEEIISERRTSPAEIAVRGSLTIGQMLKRLSLLLCVLLPGLALAQDEPAKPHPLVPGFPRYTLGSVTDHDFGTHDFQVAAEKTETVEGRYYRGDYGITEGQKVASPIELLRNYENAFKAKGGGLVWKGMDMSGGQATFRMPHGKSELWMALNVVNGGEIYDITIVERAAMDQKIELSASDMAAALGKGERVVLRGILFDTGKDTILLESVPLLDEIHKLLENDATLGLVIEGHTDSSGGKDANLALSKQRAASVKAWLVGKGIAAKRLDEKGLGGSVPVADNATPEGRAQNRRVELVRKK